MAIKLGITGGIGSGKSVVARLLETMGVPVYISDLETKRLMHTDASIRHGLTELLGEEVYADGRLNKPMLASYLFASQEQAARVNAIVHPRVKDDFRRWTEQMSAEHSVVGMESAILLEAGFQDEVDCIIAVSAPLEVRINRAVERDRSSREQIEQRIRSQMDDEEKSRRADVVILNDGVVPLIPQVQDLLMRLHRTVGR